MASFFKGGVPAITPPGPTEELSDEWAELYRTVTQIGGGSGIRSKVDWQFNELGTPLAGPMWPCPELGAEQYNWVRIRSTGMYVARFCFYLGEGSNPGAGEWTGCIWKRQDAIPLQTAPNKWLDIEFRAPVPGDRLEQPQTAKFVGKLIAGDYIGAEFQSASTVNLNVNPDPQGDPTRPDSRTIYPRFTVGKIGIVPTGL